MAKHLPPIPPASRSPSGPRSSHAADPDLATADTSVKPAHKNRAADVRAVLTPHLSVQNR